MKEFSHVVKLKFAKAFLSYWWVKGKAVEEGRLKSCRRLKVMNLETIGSPDNEYEVNTRLDKIRQTVLKEHYTNLKYIVQKDAELNDPNRVRSVEADPYRGRIRISFLRDQHIKNYLIRVLETRSNLPLDEIRPHFILGDGPGAFCYSYTGSRRYFREGSHLEADYEGLSDWIRRVKNTYALLDRIAAKMPDLEKIQNNSYYYQAPSRLTKIEFTGISSGNCSVDAILNSAFTATGPEGKVKKQRGVQIKKSNAVQARTRQEILNDYVNNVIIPQRGTV